MSETLTYDPTPADAEVLTPEEQDSLAVGEKMMAEQEQLLAGKYKNAEELEKAYVELQKKLGEQEEVPEVSETEEEAEDEPEVSPGVSLITDASSEYAENGTLSEETMQKFSQMDSKELVNAYMQLQANAPQEAPVADLSNAEVASIKESVGGEEVYGKVIDWAGKNLDSNTVEAFDSIVNSGNAKAIQLAVAGLKSQYEAANGYEGRMLSGKAPSNKSGDAFRSQQELVQAMADPRYDRDPAYRQDIMEKLERSDINF
jgi:hypothetical protein